MLKQTITLAMIKIMFVVAKASLAHLRLRLVKTMGQTRTMIASKFARTGDYSLCMRILLATTTLAMLEIQLLLRLLKTAFLARTITVSYFARNCDSNLWPVATSSARELEADLRRLHY